MSETKSVFSDFKLSTGTQHKEKVNIIVRALNFTSSKSLTINQTNSHSNKQSN